MLPKIPINNFPKRSNCSTSSSHTTFEYILIPAQFSLLLFFASSLHLFSFWRLSCVCRVDIIKRMQSGCHCCPSRSSAADAAATPPEYGFAGGVLVFIFTVVDAGPITPPMATRPDCHRPQDTGVDFLLSTCVAASCVVISWKPSRSNVHIGLASRDGTGSKVHHAAQKFGQIY